MGEAPVGSLLLKLSIPTIITMMVTMIYNIVDTAFVGTLGTSESAATGIVAGFMAVLQAIAFMCGQGGGSIMSRRLGKGNMQEAEKFASTALFFSFSLGLLIAIISFCFFDPLLDLLGCTPTIKPYAGQYIFCLLISAPFFTSSYTMNNLLRYEGKAKLGTVGLMTGAVLNIGGDALLIFVFKMGILGAGLSTAIAQTISFCILFSMYLRKRTQVRLSFKSIARDIHTFWDIAATGFPSLLRQGLFTVATTLLNRAAREYGDQAVAAMSIVNRISSFPMAIAVGIGQGFQPISAFNFGAGKKDRVKEAFWYALISGTIALTVFSAPIFAFPVPVIRALRDDPAVIDLAIRALRLLCASQILIPFTMMIEMGFQSMGAKALASFASSLRSGLIMIPSLLIFSATRGMAGIQEAQPVSILVSFVICLFLYQAYAKKLR